MAWIENCLCAYTDGRNCRNCDSCGWNPKVAEARNAEIAANGLTRGPDGLRRLIIRKGGETDGNT